MESKWTDVYRKIRNRFKIRVSGDNLPIVPNNIDLSNRLGLADLFGDLQYENIVEVGVFRGEFSIELLNRNPYCHLYCVDPWLPYDDPLRNNAEIQDRFFIEANQNLASFINNKRVTMLRQYSLDAVKSFKDESIDAVFIDGNHHFDHVMRDLIEWEKKVKHGGIVSLHDYCHMKNGGVVHAVNAFTAANNINPWFVTREIFPTAFWVKE